MLVDDVGDVGNIGAGVRLAGNVEFLLRVLLELHVSYASGRSSSFNALCRLSHEA